MMGISIVELNAAFDPNHNSIGANNSSARLSGSTEMVVPTDNFTMGPSVSMIPLFQVVELTPFPTSSPEMTSEG